MKRIIGSPVTRETLIRDGHLPTGYIFVPAGYGKVPGYIGPGPDNDMTMTVNLFPNDDGAWFIEAVEKKGGTCREEES